MSMMTSKVARVNGPHSAGIFADMTIDGPEIGTLVIIVDRAKNLPNKKTMGKQNPYCAARLGKEAQKTETDKRGGQTPKWDQELRFTVHDSPDYYNLKISVFSEDKRTDLVGEAWVNLNDVIVPGGGKNDLWQGLNCKGKYAGELRIELTYYDSRQKPEKVSDVTAEDDPRHDSKVKRRPLPQNPNVPNTTPVVIAERPLPGRARHGPRDFYTPQRPNSMPPQELSYPHSQSTLMIQKPPPEQPHSSSVPPMERNPPKQHYEPPLQSHEQIRYTSQQHEAALPPDFLPDIGQSSRSVSSNAPQQYPEPTHVPAHHSSVPQHHTVAIPHSHSAPSVPMARPDHEAYEGAYHPSNERSRHDHDVEYYSRMDHHQNNGPSPNWDRKRSDPYSDKQLYEEPNDELAPPPPPVHSSSAPIVPQFSSPQERHQHPPSRYDATPPHSNQRYIPYSSPLQSIERSHGLPQQSRHQSQPSRGHSMDTYDRSSPYQGYASTPPDSSPIQLSSPYGRTPPSQQQNSRHSISEPYNTPSRPHPLSQEVSRIPEYDRYRNEEQASSASRQYGHMPRERRSWVQDAAPLIKPRAISPNPSSPSPSQMQHDSMQLHQQTPSPSQAHQQPKASKPRNTYSIQFPVRAFESSNESPLSTVRQAQAPPRAAPIRKSVSPRPSMSAVTPSSTPFSPDSFDVHNPAYQTSSNSGTPDGRSGPFVDWDGKEIHPSDHLPVDSWAPEPEQKVPVKTYGLGRDRDFGPRTIQGVPTSTGRISKDTIINFRRKDKDDVPPAGAGATASVRSGRPQQQQQPPPRSDQRSMEPLRDRADYSRALNPYSQPEYSRSFTEGDHGSYLHDGYGGGSGPPSIPPKVPMQQHSDYDQDALALEIASIDIGSGRGRPSGGSAVAYVPVRSHRDRNNFY